MARTLNRRAIETYCADLQVQIADMLADMQHPLTAETRALADKYSQFGDSVPAPTQQTNDCVASNPRLTPHARTA